MKMRYILNIFLIALILIIIFVINIPQLNNQLINNKYMRKFDNLTLQYIDNSINKAVISFASARGLNAIISMLKSSTVNMTPAGVGASISIGEILDPVDDVVEILSTVLLLSIVSLGIQRFLLEIAPFISINLLLNLCLIFTVMLLSIQRLRKTKLTNITIKLFLFALIIKLILPFFVFLDWSTNRLFFDEKYKEAKTQLSKTNDELSSTYGAILSGEGVIEGFKNWLKKDKGEDNWLKNLKIKAEIIISSSVKLIVLFILDTLLLPLFFLWLLYRFFTYVVNIKLFTTKLIP
jgi:hypothetical protein